MIQLASFNLFYGKHQLLIKIKIDLSNNGVYFFGNKVFLFVKLRLLE